jgi:hypothetical protein
VWVIYGFLYRASTRLMLYFDLKKVYFCEFLKVGCFLSEVYHGHCASLCKISSPTDKNYRNESKNRKTKKDCLRRCFLKLPSKTDLFWHFSSYGFCSCPLGLKFYKMKHNVPGKLPIKRDHLKKCLEKYLLQVKVKVITE